MKTRTVTWMIAFVLTSVCVGQRSEEDKRFEEDYTRSERKAVAAYPDTTNSESAMVKRMVELDEQMRKQGDPRYHSPEKPMILAEIAAKELGIKPVGSKPNPSPPQRESAGIRRNTGPVLIDAQAKVAAYDAWIAQGGPLVTKTRQGYKGAGKRYATGPMKGMTVEQAKVKFESLWESTPNSVKEKYQQRAAGGIIPPRGEAPPAVADTSETDRQLAQIRLQQQEAERKRQEMVLQAERERRQIEMQQQEMERKQREIERQQEEIERRQREIER